MTPAKFAVEWPREAQADLRSIDRATAMQILYCLTQYVKTGAGDVKKLKPLGQTFACGVAITGCFLFYVAKTP